MTLFCFFLTLVPSNNVQSWNFDQRHPNNTNILIEKSLKILKFCSNGTNWTSTDLVRFGAQFVAGKPKILLKSKLSPKTASLGISNNVSARSQNKNHRILVKLSKKKTNKQLVAKLGLYFPHGPGPMYHQKFSHSLY